MGKNIGNLQEFQIHTDEMLVEKELLKESHRRTSFLRLCLHAFKTRTLACNVLKTIYSSCQQSNDYLIQPPKN